MQQPLFCYKTDLLDQILLADFLYKTIQLYSLVLTSRPCLSQPQFLNWEPETRRTAAEGRGSPHTAMDPPENITKTCTCGTEQLSSSLSTCLFLQLKNTGNLIQHFHMDWLHPGSCVLPSSPKSIWGCSVPFLYLYPSLFDLHLFRQ